MEKPIRPNASSLNPFAEPWDPEKERGKEEERTVFITFSRGHALSALEIISFFSWLYGECVEDIYIHQNYKSPPLFGKIVFQHRWVVWMVLKNEDQARYTIGGKTLWCKRYDREKKRYH